VKPSPGSDPSQPVVETPTAAPDTALAAEESGWIERARSGDERAFAQLVDRYRDRAYAIALRMLRSPGEAEEAAQDAFVRVWRALPGFRGESKFSTWLHRIVVHRCLDRAAVLRTRRGRETELEHVPELVAEADRTLDPVARMKAARLSQLMTELTEVQRIVVTLFYHQDRSLEDVARTLGLPENTVKTHLHRARAVLREGWLRDEEHE
jgi:RNA polymerase sigma-70 factor, ECF subfamily